MEKDLIRADADGYGEKCMDCVRGKPFCARKIKKESPNEGTETPSCEVGKTMFFLGIKKESPNKGTETRHLLAPYRIYSL